MVVASAAQPRFRQRKISTKQTLQILKQSQISDVDNEDLQQRALEEIETGVEKNEEEEVHLQKILKKTGLTHTANTYIPTPDASKEWPDAAKYYTGKFNPPESYIKSSCQMEDYSGVLYNMDEEDEEFLKKLNEEVTEKKDKKLPELTEDEFELMMYNFERTINEKQPFLVTDPSHILSLEEIKLALLRVDKSSPENVTAMLAEELNIHPFITHFDAKLPKKPRPLKELVLLYGEKVYEHFKRRKVARGGKSITPVLKFTGDDDNDAYICFRQRQFRQQRKTRRADVQSSEKLVRLFKELKATKELAFLVAQREVLRLESLQTEREIFELRCKVKTLKRELGITDSDEDLIAHKKKKPAPPPPQALAQQQQELDTKEENRRRGLSKSSNNANIDKSKNAEANAPDTPQQFQPYVKLPPSKIPDMELETVERLLSSKDHGMQKFVEEKLKKRKLTDVGFTNFTDDTYTPLLNVSVPYGEIRDSNHIPYSSITSSMFDVESFGYVPNVEKFIEKGVPPSDGDSLMFFPKTEKFLKKVAPEQFNPFFQKSVVTSDSILTLRKRVGRLGQTYIDRRGMVKIPARQKEDFDDEESFELYKRKQDQWKFDTDIGASEYGESDPFSDDPSKLNNISNDTQVIRFGSMLLSKAYDTLKDAILHQRQQVYFQQLQRIQQQQQRQQQGAQANGTPPAAQRKNSPAPAVKTEGQKVVNAASN